MLAWASGNYYPVVASGRYYGKNMQLEEAVATSTTSIVEKGSFRLSSAYFESGFRRKQILPMAICQGKINTDIEVCGRGISRAG